MTDRPPFEAIEATDAAPATLSYARPHVASYAGNPWFAIWVRPRKVMQWVLDTDPTRWVVGLLIGGAFAGSLDRAGQHISSLGELVASLVASMLIGTTIGFLIYYFVTPWLLTTVGRWLGGTGERVALRAATAYSMIPAIWGLAISLVALAVLAAKISSGATAGTRAAAPWDEALIGLAALNLILTIWSFLTAVACVAVAHRFTMWLSFATLLVAFALVMLVALAMVVPIVFLMG